MDYIHIYRNLKENIIALPKNKVFEYFQYIHYPLFTFSNMENDLHREHEMDNEKYWFLLLFNCMHLVGEKLDSISLTSMIRLIDFNESDTIDTLCFKVSNLDKLLADNGFHLLMPSISYFYKNRKAAACGLLHILENDTFYNQFINESLYKELEEEFSGKAVNDENRRKIFTSVYLKENRIETLQFLDLVYLYLNEKQIYTKKHQLKYIEQIFQFYYQNVNSAEKARVKEIFHNYL